MPETPATNRRDRSAARAFFAERAATWETRFPDDGPRYAAAVEALGPRPGDRALDVACGTGRAIPPLRDAVGPAGTVVAVDYVPEMLHEAARRGRDRSAVLLLADATALPLRSGAFDAIFAAALLPHLDEPVEALAELARVCRPGARLALFHAIGRAALAARHHRDVDPEDVAAPHRIAPALELAGWRCDSVEDGPERYLVVATRVAGR